LQDERSDFQSIKLHATDGIPMVSFSDATAPRADARKKHFQIGGNVFDACFDERGKLICVLDETLTARRPFALLVLNSADGRRWDDILVNDYHLKLSDIRPKKNNRYQKFDISYTGLRIYDKMIADYNDGGDWMAAGLELDRFRDAAARDAAVLRLTQGTENLAAATITLERTDAALTGMAATRKELRSKLAALRRGIGKTPTKDSAAKILRTESALEKLEERVKNAARRKRRAARRIESANAEIAAATEILNYIPARAAQQIAVAAVDDEPVINELKTIVMETQEIVPAVPDKGGEMADNNDIQPLLSQDPEIIDNGIAFKPIDFGEVPVTPPAPRPQPVSDPYASPIPVPMPAWDAPASATAPQPTPFMPAPAPQPEFSQPSEQIYNQPIAAPDFQPTPTPVPAAPTPAPAPVYGPAPVAPVYRPQPAKKQTGIYYFMLVLLIVLAVFTLWIYQKKTSGGVPNIAAVVSGTEQPTPMPVPEEPAPEFIKPAAITPEPVQVEPEQPVFVAPEPDPVAAPEPIAEIPVPEPIIRANKIEPAAPITEDDLRAVENTKPAYGVSGPTLNVYPDEDAVEYEEYSDTEYYEEEPVAEPATPAAAQSRQERIAGSASGLKTENIEEQSYESYMEEEYETDAFLD
jgi:hypothetical protein